MRSHFERFSHNRLLAGFRRNRAQFYRDLARAIAKNDPLLRFFEAELVISRNPHTRDKSRAFAMREMIRRMRKGDDYALSKTLGSVMPAEDMVMLSAVDQAKNKPETLGMLADAVTNQNEARWEFIKALIVPAILLPAIGVFAYLLSAGLIPMTVKIAPPEVWTPFNSAVRMVAEAIAAFGAPLAIVTSLCVVGYIRALSRWSGPLRLKLEQLNPRRTVWLTPIIPWIFPLAIYRDFQAGMLINGLAVLLKANKTLKEALESARVSATPWMRAHVRRILAHLNERPNEAVEAFSKGLLSPQLLARLATTLRTSGGGNFDQVLIEVAVEGNTAVRDLVRKSARILNFIFLAIAAATIAFLYFGQLSIVRDIQNELDPGKRLTRSALKQQGINR